MRRWLSLRRRAWLVTLSAGALFTLFAHPLVGATAVGPSLPRQPRDTAVTASRDDSRIIRRDPGQDLNGNRVHDYLEHRIAFATERTLQPVTTVTGIPYADLVVGLNHRPQPWEAAALEAAGAHVVWTMGNMDYDLLFAVRLGWPLPTGQVSDLAGLFAVLPGITWVGETPVPQMHMFYATRQTRVRQVWNTRGFFGRTDRALAVMDTGMDDAHPDIGPNVTRITGWLDTTSANASAPRDFVGHGTHVTGDAAGNGSVGGTIAAGTGHINISDSDPFTGTSEDTFLSFFPVDTTGFGAPAPVTLRLRWANTGGAGNVELALFAFDGAGSWIVVSSITAAMNAAQPLVLNASIPAGLTRTDFAAGAFRSVFGDTSLFSVQVNTPVTSLGDAQPFNAGMAPQVDLVGVRIFDDSGFGDGDPLAGLTFVSANRSALGIVAMNNSWGLVSGSTGVVDPTTDTAVNNLVTNGVVVVASAGNERPNPPVGSPASASAAIAVGALNENDQVTDYSTPGAGGVTPQSKPDLVAPGGSINSPSGEGIGRFVNGVDSNDVDELGNVPDRFANDYAYNFFAGTSFSSPIVAGGAVLLSQAIEATSAPWTWTGAQARINALRVKMFLGMTATETNQPAEAAPFPALNRGAASGQPIDSPTPGKDRCEGWGRMNIEAAIEAVMDSANPGDSASATLGPNPFDRKAWARHIALTGGESRQFILTVPGGADYDLFIYTDSFTDSATVSGASVGDPILAARSATAQLGGTESISFTPGADGTFYVVVKWVSGGGTFDITLGQTAQPPNAPTIAPPCPRDGVVGQSLDFTFTGTDPSTLDVRYCVDWGDGSGEECSGFVASGTGQLMSHTYLSAATFPLSVVTENSDAARSSATGCQVNIAPPPPNPSAPTISPPCPRTGDLNEVLSFTFNSTDPNALNVRYCVDWGDEGVEECTDFVASGTNGVLTHAYASRGTFQLSAVAENADALRSAPTLCQVNINNLPPDVPTFVNSCPQATVAGGMLTFEATTTDPEGDQVRYTFDWGDGSAQETTALVNSGTSASLSHQFNSVGNFNVTVRAEDSFTAQSAFSGPCVANITAVPGDYAVTDFTILTGGTMGRPFQARVTTKNVGSQPGASDTITRITIAQGAYTGTLVQVTVPPLAGGASNTQIAAATMGCLDLGDAVVTACADADNILTEANEVNNCVGHGITLAMLPSQTLAPRNSVPSCTPAFRWSSVPCATDYHIVARDCTDTIVVDRLTNGIELTPPFGLLHNFGDYTWTVTPRKGGVEGAASEVTPFRTFAPAGDSNGDGVIQARDAILTLQLVNQSAYDALADTDCNGLVEAFDAQLSLQRSVGIVPVLCTTAPAGLATVGIPSIAIDARTRSVTVPITLNTAASVVAGQLVIEYEGRVLANPRIKAGALAANALRDVRVEGTRLRIALASTVAVTGNGPLFEITFDIVGSTRTWRSTQITVSRTVLHAPTGGRLQVTQRSGTITVK